MKGDRWTPANKRAAAGFERYIRRFPSYTSAQRQTAESAFLSGFRSGVVFVEQQYRDVIRRGRPAQETSPVQAVCDRAAHLADVPTPLKAETPADHPRPGCEEWWHLKQYGYAPGGYIITCFDCKQKVWDCDKRASICRPCAEKRHSAANRRVNDGR